LYFPDGILQYTKYIKAITNQETGHGL